MSYVDSFDQNEEDYTEIMSEADNKKIERNKKFGGLLEDGHIKYSPESLKNEFDIEPYLEDFLAICGLTPSSLGRDMGSKEESSPLVDDNVEQLDFLSASLRQIKDKINIEIREILKIELPKLPFKNSNNSENSNNSKKYSGEYKNIISYGLYISGRGEESPKIVIDAKRIQNDYSEEYMYEAILLTVLVHEFIHAVMDPYNYSNYRPGEGSGLKIKYETEFGYWKEESYANAFTLKLMQLNKIWTNDWPFDQAKEFMEKQSDAYRYGAKLLPNRIDYRRWVLQKTILGIDIKEQDDWLRKAFDGKSQDEPASLKVI